LLFLHTPGHFGAVIKSGHGSFLQLSRDLYHRASESITKIECPNVFACLFFLRAERQNVRRKALHQKKKVTVARQIDCLSMASTSDTIVVLSPIPPIFFLFFYFPPSSVLSLLLDFLSFFTESNEIRVILFIFFSLATSGSKTNQADMETGRRRKQYKYSDVLLRIFSGRQQGRTNSVIRL